MGVFFGSRARWYLLVLATAACRDGGSIAPIVPVTTESVAEKIEVLLPGAPTVAGEKAVVRFQAMARNGLPVAARKSRINVSEPGDSGPPYLASTSLDESGKGEVRLATPTIAGSKAFVATLVDSAGNPVYTASFSIETTGGPPATLTTQFQSANEYACCTYAGAELHPSFIARDRFGNRVARQAIHLTAGAGSTVGDSVVFTNDSGVAIPRWTLGTSRRTYTLRATADTIFTTASATVATGSPASMKTVAGDGQTIPAGLLPPVMPVVKVIDSGGAPVAGAPVTWTDLTTGSVICSTFTGSSGEARIPRDEPGCRWIPTVSGAVTVRASTSGNVSASMNFLVLARPARFTVVSGPADGTQYPSGPNVTIPYTVRLEFADGSPAAGYTVAAASTGVTDANGLFQFSHLLRRDVGPDSFSVVSGAFPEISRRFVLYAVGPLAFGEIRSGTEFTCAAAPSAISGEPLHCWGRNSERQLAMDGPNRLTPTPSTVRASGSYYTAFDVGRAHGCFGTENSNPGRAPLSTFYACWGANERGQAGAAPSPSVAVTQFAQLKQTGSGFDHTCAVQQFEPTIYPYSPGLPPRVLCWGDNTYGQLGDGTTVSHSDARLVSGDTSDHKTFVTSGNGFSCALNGKGLAFCWGRNDAGQLGDATTTNRLVPTPVVGPNAYAPGQISAGASHTCAIGGDDITYCWGDNSAGQLGDGTLINRSSPTAVRTSLVFTRIDAGDRHTCGLTSSGAAYCWGDNSSGQLGNGTIGVPSTLPVAVATAMPLKRISAGASHTCALVASDGRAMCWGSNSQGQLGDGTTAPKTLPTFVADYRP